MDGMIVPRLGNGRLLTVQVRAPSMRWLILPAFLGLILGSRVGHSEEPATIKQVAFSDHLAGPETSLRDLKDKVVLIEHWGAG
mgnify:FL=1